MTPESKIKKAINEYLDSIGAYHVPYFTNGYGRRGVPDRLVCYRGRFVALEVKSPGGSASAWQRREIASIVAAGGRAEVVWSVDDVREIIARIDLERGQVAA